MLNHYIYIILFVIFLFVMLFSYFYKLCSSFQESFKEPLNQKSIPKVIWTYWHEDIEKAPDIIKRCIATWKKYNNDYQINTITKDNYKKYIRNFNIEELQNVKSHQLISDFIRLHILAEYGGIWCDASIILTQSLSWIENLKYTNDNVEFIGFYIDSLTTKKEFPVVESWFFACVPKCDFVVKWRDELKRMTLFHTVKDYIENVEKDTIITNIGDLKEYLVIHVAAQKIMQHKMSQSFKHLLLLKAEEGPFTYLIENNWNSKLALEYLCNNYTQVPALIKLRGLEREVMENDQKLQDCLLKRFL